MVLMEGRKLLVGDILLWTKSLLSVQGMHKVKNKAGAILGVLASLFTWKITDVCRNESV